MGKKPGKTKGLIPAIIAGGGFFALFSLIFGTFRGGVHTASLIIGLLLSVGVGALIKIMASGLDLTTHNKQDQKQNEIRDAIGTTGQPQVDEALQKGLTLLEQIRGESKQIGEEKLSADMKLLEDRCLQIFKAVADKPEKAPQIRKLMDYYLPTALKMLSSYRELGEKGLSNEELSATRARICDALSAVTDGCQSVLDKLNRGDILDVTTDIDVLEQMLKRDGLTEGDLEKIALQAREAARVDQEIANAAKQRNAAAAEKLKVKADEAPSWTSGVAENVDGLVKQSEGHIPQVPTLDGGTYYASARAQQKQ